MTPTRDELLAAARQASVLAKVTAQYLHSDYEVQLRQIATLLERCAEAMKGWEGYAWKDGKYIDDIQEYFAAALKEDKVPQQKEEEAKDRELERLRKEFSKPS